LIPCWISLSLILLVLGGDKYGHGTPLLAQMLSGTSIYTKAQPLQWNPDDKGGGANQPVTGDVVVEQTITPVPGYARAFRVHYKVTHLGNDFHSNAQQEFPAVYTNAEYNRFVYYGGLAPWSKGAATTTEFPPLGTQSPMLYVPEHWGTYVNDQNVGLTIYVPSQYPYADGFRHAGAGSDATNYFSPFAALTISPNFKFEGDYYLIVGDYVSARQIVYGLHDQMGAPDIFPPYGVTDAPTSGGTLKGASLVRGWAFDDGTVVKVELLVDGAVDGTCTYGGSRPDIPAVYPNASANSGFTYSLDTSKYANGPHVLNVRATDSAGNVAVFPNVAVTISN
jgi:Bacterial Ig domain